MTQSRRISWLVVLVVAPILLATRAAAQVYVTPTVRPTPPGQLVVVNNGPGDQTQPHVGGDLVCYTDQTAGPSTIHYFNLTSHVDAMVPPANDGSADFFCDVRGTTIVFTRANVNDRIFAFDTSVGGQPVEIAPQPGSQRVAPQIGDATIAWEDFSLTTTNSSIVAYDRPTGSTTVLSPSSPPISQNPAISSDGNVVVWENELSPNSPYVIWKATRSSAGTWASQQLVSQIGGVQLHPDTDATIIAYVAEPSISSNTSQIIWQPVASGIEQILNLPGSAINPSISGGLIAFDYGSTGAGNHQIALYDTASNVLYNLTADVLPGDLPNKTLNDISVTPDGRVRVVWRVSPSPRRPPVLPI